MDQYIGKLLDNRYELLELIGTGGMSVVYKALCHRLNRLVAVKILKSELASDEEFRRRFHDESQAVAMLSHPNIVNVYDVSHSDDLDYIVMELIDGITLKQYIQRKGGILNWRESLHFITQIVKALGHAHSRGIIHRDIKPQNIMVLRDGSVKVADFGIARLMSSMQFTLTQEALGSVHYISPEQARGSHIDARSDLYSAGVVLYEMLTGRLPFEGDTPVSVAIQHINSIPLSPRALNEDIPEALEAITMKAMASNMDQRYLNAEEMLNDLEEFRKNPEINLDYAMETLFVQPDEPTQVIRVQDREPIRRKAPENRRVAAPDREESAAGEVGRRVAIIVAVLVILGFAVGLIYLVWKTFLSGLFAPAPQHDVPALETRTLTEVLMDQEVTSVFTVEESATVFSDAPVGTIIDQEPEAGTSVKGSEQVIKVTVSAGPEYVEMISVENCSYKDALIQLQALGLSVDTPIYETSDTYNKGYVISFTPLEGTQMKPGDPVQLVVSLGPEVKKVAVMSFVGQPFEKAKKLIESNGLKVGNVIETPSESETGTVIYQSISVGTEVEENTYINLQVSTGMPEPEEETVQTMQPEVHTKKMAVTLPGDRASVRVKVAVDGVVKYDNTVDCTTASEIYPPIDGSGIQHICVYFDDVLISEFDLDFDSE